MTQQLKKRLRWLTPHVLICSTRATTLAAYGIAVRSR